MSDIKTIALVLSGIWFFWFLMWEKVKEIFKPTPEIDTPFIQETLEKYFQKLIQRILQDGTLTKEEKEDNIDDAKYSFKKTFGTHYDKVSEDVIESIKREVITAKIVLAITTIADSLLMLSPAIALYLGYGSLGVALFGILGVLGSMSLVNEAEKEGVSLNGISRLIPIGAYLMTQVPYIVLLLTNWLF